VKPSLPRNVCDGREANGTHKKANVKFSLSTPLRYIGEVKLYLHAFLTSALDGGDWSDARQFSPEEKTPETHPIGG
jgi:hypothetical protein